MPEESRRRSPLVVGRLHNRIRRHHLPEQSEGDRRPDPRGRAFSPEGNQYQDKLEFIGAPPAPARRSRSASTASRRSPPKTRVVVRARRSSSPTTRVISAGRKSVAWSGNRGLRGEDERAKGAPLPVANATITSSLRRTPSRASTDSARRPLVAASRPSSKPCSRPCSGSAAARLVPVHPLLRNASKGTGGRGSELSRF